MHRIPTLRVQAHGKVFKRGAERLRIQGVTYGPFAPNPWNEPFPEPDRARTDFQQMRRAGINTIRTYHVPPDWLLALAEEEGIAVFMGLSWSDHFCFLDNRRMQEEARRRVREAAQLGQRHNSVFAYCLGNEIRPDIIRWHGAKRVERFIAELMDEAKQIDPEGLTTYASYPSTEYLDLWFLDFLTFNVYLHDERAFGDYLLRLQNLADNRPLLLGELGMDTFRHGEAMQAEHLYRQVEQATLLGAAGAFVFAWTDDWFTGGYQIEDWAFGITRHDRSPKPAYYALSEIYNQTPVALLDETPRVSVVVCSYNGGSTLDQCLRSLGDVDYPNYDVILVDDGSTDDTKAIAARYPEVRAIHQPNKGLSVARNVGLAAAMGEIVAYTDSDCYADPDWLTHLVDRFLHTDAAGVGGPNLTPEDGPTPALVAASPGQPTHVLETDTVAEHIPGCNMAFRKAALDAIGGFDPIYRKAGDDVDICWRLQEAGYWITFAPGAFVWHHRRQTPRAYLKQQAGYGEAEALLYGKHAARFDSRGNTSWRGVAYGGVTRGLKMGRNVIYSGYFGEGLFQHLYEARAPHWAYLPGTVGWHVAAALVAVAALFWPYAWLGVGLMLSASLALALGQAFQAKMPTTYDSLNARLAVAALTYAQPLVRGWVRLRTRFALINRPEPLAADTATSNTPEVPLALVQAERNYWSETYCERSDLARYLHARLRGQGYIAWFDEGWQDRDLSMVGHSWTQINVRTVQEDHADGRRLVRAGFDLHATGALHRLMLGIAFLGAAALLIGHPLFIGGVALLALGPVVLWLKGTRFLRAVIRTTDAIALEMGLMPIPAYPVPAHIDEAEAPADAASAPVPEPVPSSGDGAATLDAVPVLDPALAHHEAEPIEDANAR